MKRLSLKILLLTALALTVIFSPIALNFFPSGISYAELDSLPAIIPDSKLDSLPVIIGDPEPDREPTSVPEPSTLLLLGGGAIGLAVVLRKKLKK